ncbi:hypothetical protein CALCODRAFT_493488 [Calocera cornea HHB12733]|uniref:Uncharacterized protein n=1 Tax=Calocera cornea HHB12733 TaxID=1353952 RepID=A0A165HPE0_9BASI|nr:hypothetical protein CALCODRAFT_493488 [Calocera cornea HHB12733]
MSRQPISSCSCMLCETVRSQFQPEPSISLHYAEAQYRADSHALSYLAVYYEINYPAISVACRSIRIDSNASERLQLH